MLQLLKIKLKINEIANIVYDTINGPFKDSYITYPRAKKITEISLEQLINQPKSLIQNRADLSAILVILQLASSASVDYEITTVVKLVCYAKSLLDKARDKFDSFSYHDKKIFDALENDVNSLVEYVKKQKLTPEDTLYVAVLLQDLT